MSGDVHSVLPAVEQPEVFQQNQIVEQPTVFQTAETGNTPECSTHFRDESLTTPDLEQIDVFHSSTARTTPCSADKASGVANNVQQTPPPAVTLRR